MKTEKAAQYFKLFSTCAVVHGVRRSTICDLQNKVYFLIPNVFNEIISLLDNKSINQAKKICKNGSLVDQYIEFAISNNLGVLVSAKLFKRFPRINNDWDTPEIITNSIFDYSNINQKYFDKFLLELSVTRCKYLQVRIFGEISKKNFNSLLKSIGRFPINIELLINYIGNEEIIAGISEYLYNTYNLTKVIIFNYNGREKNIVNHLSCKYLIFLREKVVSEKSCGIISMSSFDININMYYESKKFNSCLNKKISIDQNGIIKNCPSMSQGYGHIKEVTLDEVLEKSSFKNVWTVTKDKIAVCRDCEFRYICTDCRAYIQDPVNMYSKPLKCGYDPYAGKWEEWSSNPLSKKGIEYYKLHELVKLDE